MTEQARQLIQAAEELSREVSAITGDYPWAYHPLEYAKQPHDRYIEKFGNGEKRVLFLGMNPGPWGMTQTGVPFGEIRAVREWMGITGYVGKPLHEHPKKPVHGFSCKRSEVSGRRLWGLMESRFPNCDNFFEEHYAANFCPVIFFSDTGRNITPDKLSPSLRDCLEEACMIHLMKVIEILRPKYLIGIGVYAEKQLTKAAPRLSYVPYIGRILHPSPASPAANRGWEAQAEQELIDQGIW